jgi:hypothetical protein
MCTLTPRNLSPSWCPAPSTKLLPLAKGKKRNRVGKRGAEKEMNAIPLSLPKGMSSTQQSGRLELGNGGRSKCFSFGMLPLLLPQKQNTRYLSKIMVTLGLRHLWNMNCGILFQMYLRGQWWVLCLQNQDARENPTQPQFLHAHWLLVKATWNSSWMREGSFQSRGQPSAWENVWTASTLIRRYLYNARTLQRDLRS